MDVLSRMSSQAMAKSGRQLTDLCENTSGMNGRQFLPIFFVAGKGNISLLKVQYRICHYMHYLHNIHRICQP